MTTQNRRAQATEPYSENDAVQVLNELVGRALQSNASDLHLEPKRDVLQVRFRIDGTMVEQHGIEYSVAPQVIQRIKVLARMDIAERRVPQDGQFSLDFGQPVHLRASTFPCSQGEKVVLRLLRGQSLIAFAKLGLEPDDLRRVRDVVGRPQGFVVTCGPTGSGKTSTLYSMLQLIDTTRVNVVTLEDPIEVELMSITQGQTNPRAGFTFATGLRAILRQDPDVILVGEMRDLETARIAVQASLTGHLVLSTLHSNSSADTMLRLVDMGIEAYIVANALLGVVAQRLVRTLCPACAELHTTDPALLDELGFHVDGLERTLRATGCARCLKTGFKGRSAIFDVVPVDDEIRAVIKTAQTSLEVKKVLARKGLPTLRRAGVDLVLAGQTTLAEVLRVT